MCEGWDHSHHKTAHIFQQIVSGWKNAFSRIGLENSIFPPVNGLYACPYIFISEKDATSLSKLDPNELEFIYKHMWASYVIENKGT